MLCKNACIVYNLCIYFTDCIGRWFCHVLLIFMNILYWSPWRMWINGNVHCSLLPNIGPAGLVIIYFYMLGRLIGADQSRYSSGQLTLSSFPPRAPLLVSFVNITVECYYYRYPSAHALSTDNELKTALCDCVLYYLSIDSV